MTTATTWKPVSSDQYINDQYPGMTVLVNRNNFRAGYTLKNFSLDIYTQLPQWKRGQSFGHFQGFSEIEKFLKSF